MTSASNNEQHPRHISISEETQNGQILCSMIWLLYSTDVQKVSDISNTTSSRSFVRLLFEGRQTRGVFKTLDQSLYLVHCFVFCLKANSKTAQCQCVLSLSWILLDCIFICLKHFTASWIGKMSSFYIAIRCRYHKEPHFVHFLWNFAPILQKSPHFTGKRASDWRHKILPPLSGVR